MPEQSKTSASPASRRAVKKRPLPVMVWPLLALALLLVFNFFFTPGFFHVEIRDGRLFGSLIDVLNRGTPVMIVALGMTLVIATGGVDLSIGAIMAITGAIAAGLIARPEFFLLHTLDLHGSIALVIAISLAVALVIGLWNGLLVTALNIQPIVATLILMVAGRGLAQLLTSGQIITFESPSFEFIGGGFLFGWPFPVIITVCLLAVFMLLARRTALGLFVEAVGNNPSASRYCGVTEKLVKLIVYGASGLCAGIAGLIATADIKAADANNAGLYLELDAILAVCIGGTSMNGGRFTLIGALIGALVIQTLNTTILTLGVPPALTLVVKALVVIMVCLLQSEQFRAAFRVRRRAEGDLR